MIITCFRLAKDLDSIKNALHVYIEDDKGDMASGDEIERKEIPLNDSKYKTRCFNQFFMFLVLCKTLLFFI